MIFKAGPDRRRYNSPVHEDVAAVFVGNEGAPGKYDVHVYPTRSDSLTKVPGRMHIIHSRDCYTSPVTNMTTDDLHDINPAGFPLHELRLKVNCTVVLLKRLPNYSNIIIGPRLNVKDINEAQDCVTCTHNGEDILIYRENFVSRNLTNNFIRYQFPVKLEPYLEH